MLKKKDNLPDISIIVCSYNHVAWIERCIRSLLNQNYIKKSNYEIILVNDNSKDETKKLLKNFTDIFNLKIITNKKNLGLPKSLNKAIKVSTGRYIVRVDSDDYVSRNFLFLMKLFLDMNREYQAVAVDYVKVNEFESIIKKENCKINEIACGVMYRRECLINIGLYNEKFKMREGHEINLRFRNKFKIGRLEFALYKYRMHNKNRTKNKIRTKYFDKLLKN
jgi:glycosyltransferase involved in cell wall biosynthesis